MTDGDGILGAKKQLRQRQFVVHRILLGKDQLISWLPSLFAPTNRYGL